MILDNIYQYLTIWDIINQYLTISSNITNYLAISSGLCCSETFWIINSRLLTDRPTWASYRGAFAPKNNGENSGHYVVASRPPNGDRLQRHRSCKFFEMVDMVKSVLSSHSISGRLSLDFRSKSSSITRSCLSVCQQSGNNYPKSFRTAQSLWNR